METTNIVSINYNELIREFEKHTGWSSSVKGVWNADFTKTVFDVDLTEVFQHEQDWMTFVYADDSDPLNKNKEFLLKKENSNEYKGNIVYNLFLSDIVSWMVMNNHLPNIGEFLVVDK